MKELKAKRRKRTGVWVLKAAAMAGGAEESTESGEVKELKARRSKRKRARPKAAAKACKSWRG